ncbi:BRISC and BRCA1-A complex member 2-like isoform X3 [Penaeus chinensis]|uniref:BRISC and BRCA1-A complex member 2-like isoform X3 n=1 Tax=Penaeus chinensis TaxID=139456 RepID=UPI001FB6F6E4|nr:BRISC and BRCA1-A complex member 2-like isoform X3 [Penaeus chinensis]XP_047476308.1 BRISC and BRCA1-A complex member 2-like isoform X3 [Penaeus chinensis]
MASQEPWMPPDISFSDIHFLSRLSAQDLTEQVPSLNTWNSLEDDIIAQLLHQLLQLYKRYQLEKLETDDVMQFVYESLLKTLSIGEGDIEVSVGNQGSQYSSLLVRLPLSLQDVPPVLVDANTGPATSLLHVTFQGTEGVFIPKLHLSPRIESLIGGASTLALPAVPPGACLMDYVERILQLLEQRVRKAVLSFEMRKQFVAQKPHKLSSTAIILLRLNTEENTGPECQGSATTSIRTLTSGEAKKPKHHGTFSLFFQSKEILCQFGCAVLEYDAERFCKVVLLFEVKDFHFLTFITLSPLFPQQQAPKVVLQSLYHNSPREPYSMELTDLSYNSQWNAEEMVRHIKQGIQQNVSSFQTASIKTAL